MKGRGIYHIILATALAILAGCGGGGGSGVGNASVPASITVTASQAKSVISNPVTVTANVKQANGTAVADGTSVTFSATGGTGATFSPTTVTTSGGNATTTFNSTAAGTFVITATAGTVTSTPLSMPVAAQATQAIVKLATSGQLAPSGTLIGAIQATLTYPTTKGLSIGVSDVVISGVGRGLFAPNTNTPGQVSFGQIDIQPGIPIGEFLTATFSIAAGNPQVAAGDFAISAGANITNVDGTAQPNVAVVILSVVIQ